MRIERKKLMALNHVLMSLAFVYWLIQPTNPNSLIVSNIGEMGYKIVLIVLLCFFIAQIYFVFTKPFASINGDTIKFYVSLGKTREIDVNLVDDIAIVGSKTTQISLQGDETFKFNNYPIKDNDNRKKLIEALQSKLS